MCFGTVGQKMLEKNAVSDLDRFNAHGKTIELAQQRGRKKARRGQLESNLLGTAHRRSIAKTRCRPFRFQRDLRICSSAFQQEDFINFMIPLDASCLACSARVFRVVNGPIVQEI